MSVALNRSLYINTIREFLESLVSDSLITDIMRKKAQETAIELNSLGERRLKSPQAALEKHEFFKEAKLIQHYVENHACTLVDLTNYEFTDDAKKRVNFEATWATWTLPFDIEEGYHLVVTAYPKSEFVKNYWKGQLGGAIIWHLASTKHIAEILERLEAELKKQ